MAKLGQVNPGIPPLLRALKAINHVLVRWILQIQH